MIPYLLKRRLVVRAVAPGTLAKDRYRCFFAASSGLPGPLHYVSLPTAGEALVEPLFISNEKGSLTVPMGRALAT